MLKETVIKSTCAYHKSIKKDNCFKKKQIPVFYRLYLNANQIVLEQLHSVAFAQDIYYWSFEVL